MKAFAVVALVAGLASVPAFANCVEPSPVTDLPNGATATGDAMRVAFKAVRAYDAAVKKYADCLQSTGASAAKQNEAVETLHRVADKFNSELRAFKAKNGS